VFNHPALRAARVGLPVGALVIAVLAANAGARAQSKKDFAVVAHKYGYQVDGNGAEIHVQQDDLVRITFTTDDIPHSFTLEDETYRIMRRAEPGKPVTFEFRADKAGRFPFKCTLTADERCKEMQGWLVVDAKKQSTQR
jgi:heme/copper-type cytochrome/quinol oxidase subunit 2